MNSLLNSFEYYSDDCVFEMSQSGVTSLQQQMTTITASFKPEVKYEKPCFPLEAPQRNSLLNPTPGRSPTNKMYRDYENSSPQYRDSRKKCIQWQQDEDEMLARLVAIYAGKQWGQVARELSASFAPGRSINQCNQRWMRVLHPDIKKGKWNHDEDVSLLKALIACEPGKWRDVAAIMPGRTDIQVRYRVKKIGVWLMRNGVGAERLEICIE